MEVCYQPCSYITGMGKPAKYATVAKYMQQCTHPLKKVIELLRRIICGGQPELKGHSIIDIPFGR